MTIPHHRGFYSGIMTLEEFLARFNENLFFREFSFSQTKFTPLPKSELELADHIVWLDDFRSYAVELRHEELRGGAYASFQSSTP